MTERPILFSGAMVRAILAGTKTQTRRTRWLDFPNSQAREWTWELAPATGEWVFSFGARRNAHRVVCPYGVPGDRLWVRETFYPSPHQVFYRADVDNPDPTTKWTPSIHMPRATSRLQLHVVAVRVERLQDITEHDAKAEGCQQAVGGQGEVPVLTYRTGFVRLWDSINLARGQGWLTNPLVWVVEFTRA
jgi:hypothetical protein